MSDTTESPTVRLWRDRAQLREQERNEALVLARMAEERIASLTAESARLASENARLRAFNQRLVTDNARLRTQLTPDPACARGETEQGMEDVRSGLLSLLAPTSETQA